MVSRRTFLHRLGHALPAAWLLPAFSTSRLTTTTSPDLPYGLFYDADDLPALRQRFASHPLFSSLREDLESIDREAERQFMREEVQTNDLLYHFARLYRLAPRMALYYAMTGDEDASALTMEMIRTMMRFPKWDYFLEGDEVLGLQRAAGAVVATACAADWLGDAVTAEERTDWLRTMGQRGCEACFVSIYGMRYPERVQGWRFDPESAYLEHRPEDRDMDLSNWPHILDRTNLKIVPAAALALGAVAYEQQFGQSERTERWIEQAVYSIRTFQEMFAADGSYDEGISYANYSASHLAQALAVLARHRRLDLYDHVNWPGFIDYACGLAMPTEDDPHAVVNFGDAGKGLRSDVPFWVAARFGDERAQWYGATLAHAHTEWSLIWYDADLPAVPPPDRPTVWHSDLDWIVARSGFDADDLVVAMRSGGPSNHEHADRNSVIVKAFGEVLVADPYRPPYSSGDPAWMMRTTAGHSALLIDGEGHQYHRGEEGTNASEAAARIVRNGERDGYAFWTSDATPAYRLVLPHVASVTRSVYVLYDLPAVLVLDKVVTDGTPVRLQARYFGDNRDDACQIQTEKADFQLMRPHAALHASGISSIALRAESGLLPIPEERARQHPFVDLATADAATSPLLITVLRPVPAGTAPPPLRHTSTKHGHRLTLGTGAHQVTSRILDSGPIPDVHLDTST